MALGSGDRVPRIGMLNTLACLFGTTVSYLTRDATDDITLTEQKSPSVITQPSVQHAAPIPHDELPPNVKKSAEDLHGRRRAGYACAPAA